MRPFTSEASAPASANESAPDWNCPPLPFSDLDPLVQSSAAQESLDPDLIWSVIHKESADRPCAVSRKGAQGLMQLMPSTAKQLGVTDPFDARENVTGGSHLLKTLLDRYEGDRGLALAAYNAGPEAVERSGGIPAIPETQDYVRTILNALRTSRAADFSAPPQTIP